LANKTTHTNKEHTVIKITKRDALRAKILDPGWYSCIVDGYEKRTASTDGGTLHQFEITVEDGQHKGVPLNAYVIPEKVLGIGKPFFSACGLPSEIWTKAEAGEEFEFDPQNLVGKKLRVMVKPEAFGNRTLNKAFDFMAVQEASMVPPGRK
jgi:hypothetical protein